VKFWGYVVINAEQLCAEFCNFVQCHIFVNYLSFTVNEWNIKIKLRLPEIELLAVVPTQLKFSIVKDHDEPTILLFEKLFCMWECFNMGTVLPTKVMLRQTLVLIQMPFLNNVRKVGRLVLPRTSCFVSFLSGFSLACGIYCCISYFVLYYCRHNRFIITIHLLIYGAGIWKRKPIGLYYECFPITNLITLILPHGEWP
jgi:hypothetical protein